MDKFGTPLHVTVPAGWTTFGDFVLMSPEGFEAGYLGFWDVDDVNLDACHWNGRANVGPSVDELVAGLVGQLGMDVTAPTAIEVDGRAGQALTMSPADVDPATCDEGPVSPWFEADGDSRFYAAPGETETVWIVDLDGRRAVLNTGSVVEVTRRLAASSTRCLPRSASDDTRAHATRRRDEATQRTTWDRFSTGWERWDDLVQHMLGPVGEAMIRSLGIRADQHHLDVAAGTGHRGISIAQLAPRGRVALTDLASEDARRRGSSHRRSRRHRQHRHPRAQCRSAAVRRRHVRQRHLSLRADAGPSAVTGRRLGGLRRAARRPDRGRPYGPVPMTTRGPPSPAPPSQPRSRSRHPPPMPRASSAAPPPAPSRLSTKPPG